MCLYVVLPVVACPSFLGYVEASALCLVGRAESPNVYHGDPAWISAQSGIIKPAGRSDAGEDPRPKGVFGVGSSGSTCLRSLLFISNVIVVGDNAELAHQPRAFVFFLSSILLLPLTGVLYVVLHTLPTSLSAPPKGILGSFTSVYCHGNCTFTRGGGGGGMCVLGGGGGGFGGEN